MTVKTVLSEGMVANLKRKILFWTIILTRVSFLRAGDLKTELLLGQARILLLI